MPTRLCRPNGDSSGIGRTPTVLGGCRELAIGLAVFAGYLAVTHLLPVNRPMADARGRWLLSIERSLWLDWESAADRWLAAHPLLGWLAAWEYATTYVVTTFLLLGWLWWRRPQRYAWARNTLAWTTLIAIVCFAVIPTTPPRLLPGGHYTDIVARFHPIASWGSGISASADQFAALPSLHIGWAAWVAAVSLRAGVSRRGYTLATVHLAVTAAVVVATGNHYVLDIVAGIVLVWLAVSIERLRTAMFAPIGRASPGARGATLGQFFLHVEAPAVRQPVGGLVILDSSRATAPLDLAAMRALVAERLPRMPRFRERLRPTGRGGHARWLPAPDADLRWHVREHVLPGAGGRGALDEFVAHLAKQELDRSRPLWQIWFVPNAGPGEAAAVGIMHHAFADGLGVVDILRQLFDPGLPPPDHHDQSQPSQAVQIAGIVSGLGRISDGRADRLQFGAPLAQQRRYGTAVTGLGDVREVARQTGARVTDVLVAATGEAVSRLLSEAGASTRGLRLRAAVPMTTRHRTPTGTGQAARAGNLTTALRLDVPLDAMPVLDRLRATARQAEARRRSGCAFTAAAVMRLIGVLPPPLTRRVTRAMHRSRFFTTVVSTMPGPSAELRMASAPVKDVYPVVSLAEGVPLGIATLGWAGQLCLSVLVDPRLLPEAPMLAALTVAVIEEMRQDVCAPLAPVSGRGTTATSRPGTALPPDAGAAASPTPVPGSDDTADGPGEYVVDAPA